MNILSILIAVLPVFTSLEADFVQEKTSPLFADVQVSTGHLTYRQPSYLRWAYLTPVEMVWESGADSSSGQAAVSAQIAQMIMRSIDGSYLKPNDDFEAKQEGNVVTLTPKRRQLRQLFVKLTVILNSKTGIADEVCIDEKSGDRTVIRFINSVSK